MNELPLRDIHPPDPVSWWPPAPGWWILLFLIIGFAIFIPWFIRWVKNKPIHKVAKREFKTIEETYNTHQDDILLVRDISIFLRRVLMSFEGRKNTASLTGVSWLKKLNTLTPKDYFTEDIAEALLQAPYQQQGQINPQELLTACNKWLEALPRRKP